MSVNDILTIIWSFFFALFVYRLACGMAGLKSEWIKITIINNSALAGEE